MHQCPCMDNTQGHITEGKCIAPFRCKGEKTDGKAPELPKIPEMKPPEKKPPEEPKQQEPKCDCSQNATSTSQTASSTPSPSGTQTGRDAQGNACTCDSASSFGTGFSADTSGSYGGYSYDYGSNESGGGAFDPFIDLIGGLQSGQVGSGFYNGGYAAGSGLSDQGSIISSYEPQSFSQPYVSGRPVSIGGATGFAPPTGFGSGSSSDDPSLIQTIGDVMSSAGEFITDTAQSAWDGIKSAVTGEGSDSNTPDEPSEEESAGTESSGVADAIRDGEGPVQHVGEEAGGTAVLPPLDTSDANVISAGGQQNGAGDSRQADPGIVEGAPSSAASNEQPQGSGTYTYVQPSTSPNPGTAPAGAAPSSGAPGTPRTPSLPTTVTSNSGGTDVGMLYAALSGIIGSIELLLSGIADFLRGLFSVFV